MLKEKFLKIWMLEKFAVIMSPQQKWGRDILFLVQIPSASAAASALLCFRVLSFEPIDGFLPNLKSKLAQICVIL